MVLKKYFWIFLLFACTRQESLTPSNIANGIEYYPTTIGKYIIYNVKKITYNYTQKSDTQYYQLKEILADTFIDLENKVAYKLERYIRYERSKEQLNATLDSTWKIDSVWNARINAKQVIVFESNVPYVKLNLPIQNGKQWNGNQYNTRGVENYKVSDIFTISTTIKAKYESTITIIHKNDSSAINRDKRVEIYAKNVGLVYQQKIVYEDACKYNFDGAPCVPGDKIANGIHYEQEAILYGIQK